VITCCYRLKFLITKTQSLSIQCDTDISFIVYVCSFFSDALGISDVADFFRLETFEDRHVHIQATCALNGDGVLEGMLEMAHLVKDFEIDRLNNLH
jgi:hypothetical protein